MQRDVPAVIRFMERSAMNSVHFGTRNAAKGGMAKKVRPLVNALELPLGAEIVERRPVPQVSPLYLMRRRSPKPTSSRPRNRVQIAVEADRCAEITRPVKIVHLD
jgi:hypothetical protein